MEMSGTSGTKRHGIIISGGAFDIDPSYYGEEVRGRIDRRDEDRTQLELCLARMALTRNIPLLGICGGMQVSKQACGSYMTDIVSPLGVDLPPSSTAPSFHPAQVHRIALCL